MFNNEIDKLKTTPVETCDESTRKVIAKSIANFIKESIPHDPHDDVRLPELERNGYIPIKVINDQEVVEVVDNLKTKSVYNAHVPYGDNIKRNLQDARAFPFGCYELDDIISCPHLLRIALSEEVLNLAENYLGCTPTLYSMNSWWSFPGKGVAVTQSYHRDYDDYKFLALFIYLTDVTVKNGAHCFIKHTHNNEVLSSVMEVPENLLSICDGLPYKEVFVGKAGTTFLSDTYGVHQSMPLVEGDRLVMWARYGLSHNGPSMAQIRKLSSRGLNPDNIQFDDRLKYITRLILTD